MISIIGAGPAGSYLSYLLSKKGEKIHLYEEHKEIGKPTQCTGLITSSIKKIIKVPNKIIINKFKEIKIISKNNTLSLKLKNENLLINRELFDKFLADQAQKQGTKIFLNHKFIKYQNHSIIFKNKKTSNPNILIGADGPLSKVSKIINKQKIQHNLAIQATIKNHFNPKTIKVYLTQNYLSWLVPEDEETAKLGLIAKNNTTKYFNKFIKNKGKITNITSGLIPIYNPKIRLQKNNIFLIGDAATLTKATTYGGIIQSILSSKILAKTINTKNYQQQIKKTLKKDLYTHLLLRRIINKFTDKDYNLLLELCKKPKTKEILQNHDRDFISKFFFHLIISQPKLLTYSKKFF